MIGRRWGGCRFVDRLGRQRLDGGLIVSFFIFLLDEVKRGGGRKGYYSRHTHGCVSGMGFIPRDGNPGVGTWWAITLGCQGTVRRCVLPDPESLTRSVDGGEMDGGGGVSGDESDRTGVFWEG